MAVKLVADTGCDLPDDLLARYDIRQVPLILRFGEQEVADSPATRAQLWQRVEQRLPCGTSGPPAGDYVAAFTPLVAAGHQVLCITLTGAHSVTYTSAALAAQDFAGQVAVMDSRSISLGYGLQVLEAAETLARGADLHTARLAAESVQARLKLLFFMESLDQVQRGGRLDGLMPLLNRLGSALNLRALLTISHEGRIALAGPARGRRGAMRRVVEDLAVAAPVERLAVVHSRAADEAAALADQLAVALNFPRREALVVEIGSVLVAHAGRGLLGAGVVTRR